MHYIVISSVPCKSGKVFIAEKQQKEEKQELRWRSAVWKLTQICAAEQADTSLSLWKSWRSKTVKSSPRRKTQVFFCTRAAWVPRFPSLCASSVVFKTPTGSDALDGWLKLLQLLLGAKLRHSIANSQFSFRSFNISESDAETERDAAAQQHTLPNSHLDLIFQPKKKWKTPGIFIYFSSSHDKHHPRFGSS